MAGAAVPAEWQKETNMADSPQHSDASWASMLAGMVVGAVIGAGVSLLYAPKPGKELRDAVCQQLDELREYVDQTTRELAEAAKTRLAEVQSDIADAMDGARAAATEQADAMTRATEAPVE